MEVIYMGNQLPKAIIKGTIGEGADVVGISILGGSHLTLCPTVAKLLRKNGADDILLLMGGVIPPADIPLLKEAGIVEVFPFESSIEKIIDFMNSHAEKAQAVV